MTSKKLKIDEGTVIAVPLDCGGWAVGLVARRNRNAILSYFFSPRFDALPDSELIDEIVTRRPITSLISGDMGLRTQVWPILGTIRDFRRADWPSPWFGNINSLLSPALSYRIRHRDDDIFEEETRERCSLEEAHLLPLDGMHGHVAAQQRLSKLLCPGPEE